MTYDDFDQSHNNIRDQVWAQIYVKLFLEYSDRGWKVKEAADEAEKKANLAVGWMNRPKHLPVHPYTNEIELCKTIVDFSQDK